MNQIPLFLPPGSKGRDTLSDARRDLMDRGRWEKAGVRCPCCDQRAKVYARPLNATMARSLVTIYRHFAKPGADEWVSLPRLLHSSTACGDAAKLACWGLVEPKGDVARDDGSPRVGLYRATEKGWAFVRGQKKVPHRVLLYAAEVLGFSDDLITIAEALGEPFNFSTLMQPAREEAHHGP